MTTKSKVKGCGQEIWLGEGAFTI